MIDGPTELNGNKQDAPDPVEAGDVLAYTIRVSNTRIATAQGVVLTDPIPANTTFVAVSSTEGTCTTLAEGASSGIVTCNLGTIAPNTSTTVQILVKPTAEAGEVGGVMNTVVVQGANTTPASDTEATAVESS